MSTHREEWALLWDRAKLLKSQIPIRKRDAFAELNNRFPDLEYKNFGGLARAALKGKLTNAVAAIVVEYDSAINKLIAEAAKCRQESDRLLKAKQQADIRPFLDPAADPIPTGSHSKLCECRIYPLRRDCNYGENEGARWKRCEYMKYDNGKLIFDPTRWMCTASE